MTQRKNKRKLKRKPKSKSVIVDWFRRKGEKKARPITKPMRKLKQKKVIVKPKKMKTIYANKETRKFIIHGREFWLAKNELVAELGIEPSDVETVWRGAKEDMDREALKYLKHEALTEVKEPTVQQQVKKSTSILDVVAVLGKKWVNATLAELEASGKRHISESVARRSAPKTSAVPEPRWDTPAKSGGWGEEMD